MRIKVKHSKCGTIYYVTPKMLKEADYFIPVNEETGEPEELSAIGKVKVPVSEEEELKELLTKKGVSFHPSCGIKTLRKKLEEAI